MRGQRWADDPAAIAAMQRKVPQSVGACFELIERDMLKGPWVMGEAYTICDPYLFGVDPVWWTVCRLGRLGFLEYLHLVGNRG
jgi:glutathione S-transferase